MTNPDWPGKSPVDHRAISILRFLAIFDVARLSPTSYLPKCFLIRRSSEWCRHALIATREATAATTRATATSIKRSKSIIIFPRFCLGCGCPVDDNTPQPSSSGRPLDRVAGRLPRCGLPRSPYWRGNSSTPPASSIEDAQRKAPPEGRGEVAIIRGT